MKRRLKIQGEYRQSSSPVNRRYSRGWFVPLLLLRGRWLEKAGFSPFDYASVTIQDDKLIIEPLKKGDIND